MTIIVDASIIISTLINPSGKEASLIFNNHERVDFVAPALVFQEVLSKKSKILSSTHHSESSIAESILLLETIISIFDVEKFSKGILDVAKQLTYSIDEKDTQYIALTIQLEGLFWTGDLKLLRGLKRKDINQIITTLDFEQILKGL
jgi:predicted nucleic acid-binding protein